MRLRFRFWHHRIPTKDERSAVRIEFLSKGRDAMDDIRNNTPSPSMFRLHHVGWCLSGHWSEVSFFSQYRHEMYSIPPPASRERFVLRGRVYALPKTLWRWSSKALREGRRSFTFCIFGAARNDSCVLMGCVGRPTLQEWKAHHQANTTNKHWIGVSIVEHNIVFTLPQPFTKWTPNETKYNKNMIHSKYRSAGDFTPFKNWNLLIHDLHTSCQYTNPCLNAWTDVAARAAFLNERRLPARACTYLSACLYTRLIRGC